MPKVTGYFIVSDGRVFPQAYASKKAANMWLKNYPKLKKKASIVHGTVNTISKQKIKVSDFPKKKKTRKKRKKKR